MAPRFSIVQQVASLQQSRRSRPLVAREDRDPTGRSKAATSRLSEYSFEKFDSTYSIYAQRRTVHTQPKPASARSSSVPKTDPSNSQSPASSMPSFSPSRTPPKPAASFPSPASLNAFAVSQLSAYAHPSRPTPKISDGQLPEGYRNVARKLTYAIVALPIVIVTSWVLYQRCKYTFP